MRALERHDVDRLLDDTDDRAVAPRVRAHLAELFLGEISALAAEANSSLDLLDRAGELNGILGAGGEKVKREPLSGPATDAGKLRELGDEILDSRAEHAGSVAV